MDGCIVVEYHIRSPTELDITAPECKPAESGKNGRALSHAGSLLACGRVFELMLLDFSASVPRRSRPAEEGWTDVDAIATTSGLPPWIGDGPSKACIIIIYRHPETWSGGQGWSLASIHGAPCSG